MARETCCQKFNRLVIVYILVPLSVPFLLIPTLITRILDKYMFEWFQSRHISSPAEHRAKVAKIQAQVREWNAAGRPSRMCTGKPLWNSWNLHGINKRELARINVDELTSVVQVDEVNCVLTVEPGMMMGQLSSILIPMGWTIPVVPEFETLTVGGTICGTGIETGSCQWGLSSDIALEYEVVVSTGEVVTCSKDENSDLFYSIPWSHGTLGFLTAAKLRLVPAKKYMQIEYKPTSSFEEAQKLLENQEYDFVEGIAYGPQKFVVTYGQMADEAIGGRVNHVNRWYKPFWYKHMKSFLKRRTPKGAIIEYIPLRDYFHRHTRSYFWTLPGGFLPYSHNCLVLALVGWMLPLNTKIYRRIMFAFVSNRVYNFIINNFFDKSNYVLQDFIVPMKELRPTLNFVEEELAIYPLWLCPCKFFKKPGMAHSDKKGPETELYIDVGIYGTTPQSKAASFHPENTIRKLEHFAIEHAGVQFLYADSFMSRDEFYRMFDMGLYEEVRAKYGCEDAFPHVYDKVSKAARQIGGAQQV